MIKALSRSNVLSKRAATVWFLRYKAYIQLFIAHSTALLAN